MTQCEQGIVRHEEFLKTTDEAEMFLQQAKETLANCANPSGDQDMCQDKLHTSEVLFCF